jgi:hypothetical protein
MHHLLPPRKSSRAQDVLERTPPNDMAFSGFAQITDQRRGARRAGGSSWVAGGVTRVHEHVESVTPDRGCGHVARSPLQRPVRLRPFFFWVAPAARRARSWACSLAAETGVEPMRRGRPASSRSLPTWTQRALPRPSKPPTGATRTPQRRIFSRS